MKRLLFIFLLSGLPILLSSQISKVHNSLRPGDEIIKQQVSYGDPGEAGVNILWDFSKQETINEQYNLSYTPAPLWNDSLYIMGYNRFGKKDKRFNADDLIVGTEHNTMYYYRIIGDSLLLLGHENPVAKLQYVDPYVLMTYPMNYSQTVHSSYTTQGRYSVIEPVQTVGTVETTADAYGKMILPTGDTLNPVLRIKTVQTIEDKLASGNTIKQLETYRWYTKGYRYPVFETIRNIDKADNLISFATSFFYPPQDHLYIQSDPENQKLLDEMWTIEEDKQQEQNTDNRGLTTAPLITYKTYPNPVESTLYLDYSLSEDAQVSISLYSVVDGKVFHSMRKQHQQAGDHSQTIDCHRLPTGSYILQIIIDNQMPITQTIIKK